MQTTRASLELLVDNLKYLQGKDKDIEPRYPSVWVCMTQHETNWILGRNWGHPAGSSNPSHRLFIADSRGRLPRPQPLPPPACNMQMSSPKTRSLYDSMNLLLAHDNSFTFGSGLKRPKQPQPTHPFFKKKKQIPLFKYKGVITLAAILIMTYTGEACELRLHPRNKMEEERRHQKARHSHGLRVWPG